jgi:hypothetical protein
MYDLEKLKTDINDAVMETCNVASDEFQSKLHLNDRKALTEYFTSLIKIINSIFDEAKNQI